MMQDAVKRIVARFGLTPRELDVVLALTEGHVTSRDLGRHLGLSESTVENHIANISHKSGLGGKSELLVFLIQKSFQLLENARFFVVTPSILVLDDHSEIADLVTEALRGRGCHASAAYEVHDDLTKRIVEEQVELIICDVRLGRHDGIEFLRGIKDHVPNFPSVVVISATEVQDRLSQPFVAAWHKKPLDMQSVFDSAVDAIISRSRRSGRGERMAMEADVLVDGGAEAHTYEIGVGGMAIRMRPGSDFDAGRAVKFEVELPEKTVIRGEGQTVWTKAGKGAKAGELMAGIRFDKLDHLQQELLDDYIRTKNILRFIPFDRTLEPKKRRSG